jgi:CRP-like cAMP-binding protein
VGREGFTIPYPTRRVIFEAGRKAADPGKDRTDAVRLLEGVEFLRPLGKEGLARLAPLATVQHFASGEEVVRQGERGEAFYVIVSGAALQRVEGAKEEPARLGPGECFGETALLSDAPHEATVSALGDTKLLCVKRAAVKDALRGQDDASRALAQALAGRKARLPSRG